MERRLSLTQMKKGRYVRISLIGGLAERVMKDGMQTSFCKENYLKKNHDNNQILRMAPAEQRPGQIPNLGNMQREV